MFFIVQRDREDSMRPQWRLMDHQPYETHELAHDVVLGEIQADKDASEEGRWEYLIVKVWTTFAAYGA